MGAACSQKVLRREGWTGSAVSQAHLTHFQWQFADRERL